METIAFITMGPTKDSLFGAGAFLLIMFGLWIVQRIREQRRSRLNPPGGILSTLKKRNR